MTVYLRYVDDILIVAPSTQVDRILQISNANTLNIKFNLEKESERAINFMGITITRKKNKKHSFNWYRKPTWLGRYLNFNSHHPLRYKKSVINKLVNRALLLSDREFHNSNLQLITDTLVENDYQ